MQAIPKSPRQIVAFLLCLAFGAVFIYAGVLKVTGLGLIEFTDDIRSFHLIQDPLVAWVAMFLPWFEILCGAAVVLGVLRRGGLLLLNLSLVVFLAAIIQAWARGIDISCGCFGKSTGASAASELIIRDLILLAVGLFLSWEYRRKSPDHSAK